MQHISTVPRFQQIGADLAKRDALKKLEAMSDQEFDTFLASLPERVGLLVRSRMVDWREVLPEWYIKQHENNQS